MNKNKILKALVLLRNGLAFSFSWLVLCTMALAAYWGIDNISTALLGKIFLLCFWAVICFIICFKDLFIRKKGFIFRLTLFYVMFVPAEIFGFYSMRIFVGNGSLKEWGIFVFLIMGLYVSCLLIDWIVCRKRGIEYTRNLLAYNERRLYEQSTGNSIKNQQP